MPLNNNRIIGSYECLSKAEANNYINKIKKDIKYKIVLDINNEYEFIYYKDNTKAKKALALYIKYIKSGGLLDSITLKEHRFLGKCFGYDDNEIDWFIQDIKGEY